MKMVKVLRNDLMIALSHGVDAADALYVYAYVLLH